MRNERNDHHARVIVGVDNQEGSMAALQCAAEEARRRNAVLVAVAVWSPFGGDIAERTYPCPQLDAFQKASAVTMLESACERAGLPDDLTVERRVEKGFLGPVLANLANGPHDLLVVGLRYRQGFSWLRPSTDKYCLRYAAAPVLVVPSGWASCAAEPALIA
ncbi:universal stress protein [Streptomyces sp. NPDC101151]|uniref:universal stress protein n=1 Tax=Streptomyces sp. NPDC101151 TaxID=3366115 RepID=UPI0038259C43